MSGVPQITLDREAWHDWDVEHPERYVWLVDWKRHGKPYCSLYVIAPEGHWPSKIGISIKPEKRVRQLQTAHWRALVVAECFWCKSVKDARALEDKVHETLDDDGAYLLGEWFDKPAKETVEIIRFCASVIGVEIHDTIEDGEIIEALRGRVAQEWGTYQSVRGQGTHGGSGPIYNFLTGEPID